MTTIIENLKWRYATQKFDTSKTIAPEDLETILEAGNLSATAYGLQPLQMVVVTDPEKKQALIPAAYNQTHVGDNSALIVLAARTDIDEAYISEYTARIEATRRLPEGTTDGYKTMMVNDLTNRTPEARLIWAQKQAYIVLGTLMAAASELRIDNHALEGFNPTEFNQILDLEKHNLTATVILALGYRSRSDDTQHWAKVRKPLNDIVVRI
ncbi:MAG: NAD(P)H-dependent oxidoreductase [Patescibacteria group bacterium]